MNPDPDRMNPDRMNPDTDRMNSDPTGLTPKRERMNACGTYSLVSHAVPHITTTFVLANDTSPRPDDWLKPQHVLLTPSMPPCLVIDKVTDL